MDDCIFCKIAKGEMPCHKIAEDDDFIAFLDIKPFTVGHTMVIPKKHYRWTYDVPNFGEYWEFVKMVTQKINQGLKPFFVTYLTMGMQVNHAHVHIIPRYENDNLVNEFAPNLRLQLSNEELINISSKITL